MRPLKESEKKFLGQLHKSPSGLRRSELEELGFKKTWFYNSYPSLEKYVKKESKKENTSRGRPITIYKLTEDGKKKVENELNLYTRAVANLKYAIDLGSEGEMALSFDAHAPEDKYRYEAYWLTHAPLITPFLRMIDFEKPIEVNITAKITVPRVSKDIIGAANFFAGLNEKIYNMQYWFWNENIQWLQTSVAKGQGVWNTPYKDVGEACDLAIKSYEFFFTAMMWGLTAAKSGEDFFWGPILLRNENGEFMPYYLKFAPLNIFEFLLMILPCIKKGEKLTWSKDHLGMALFLELLRQPEIKEWIKRCVKKDGRNWLFRIPFEKIEPSFQRNKEHVSDNWIFDTNFPLSLGVFFSIEKKKWPDIGGAMIILLDTIMLNKLPSRLGDELDYEKYTDDVILEAWDRVKYFWQEVNGSRKRKREISMHASVLYKNKEFLAKEKKFRYLCCEFLKTVNGKWNVLHKKPKGTRELSNYLPRKGSSLSQYKAIEKIIEDIKHGKKPLAILGSGREKLKMIAEEEYNPDKKLVNYMKKLDYDDLMTKLAELSKTCPPYIKQNVLE